MEGTQAAASPVLGAACPLAAPEAVDRPQLVGLPFVTEMLPQPEPDREIRHAAR